MWPTIPHPTLHVFYFISTPLFFSSAWGCLSWSRYWATGVLRCVLSKSKNICLWKNKKVSDIHNNIRKYIWLEKKHWNVLLFLAFRLLFWNLGEKVAIFLKFCRQFRNLRLGVCLANCLKFPEFEAGCAYKLVAYKRNVYEKRYRGCKAFAIFLHRTVKLTFSPQKAGAVFRICNDVFDRIGETAKHFWWMKCWGDQFYVSIYSWMWN